MSIFKGARPTIHQLILTFVGLLFSLALLKAITQFGEFRRKDEDHIWLALTANRLGNYSGALRHLRNVKSWDEKARSAEIVALLGVNEIAEAEEKSKDLLKSQHKDTSVEMIFVTMLEAFLLPHMPRNVYVDLLRRGIEMGVPDAIMQDCLGPVVQNKLQDEAIAVFSGEAAARFPLSTARILLFAGDLKGCIEILEANHWNSNLDQLIGRVLRFFALTVNSESSADERRKIFSSFVQEVIPLMRKLKDAPHERWEQMQIFQEVQRTLSFAREYDPDRIHELQFIADSLKDEEKDKEAQRQFELIESQFQ